MTRILLISGSLRHGSTNTALLRTIEQMAPPSIDVELYGGVGSLAHFDPDLDRDPLPLSVQELRAAVRDADAILFCTPEYAAALPGSFKNVLDWTIGDDHPRSIFQKPVAWINASANSTRAGDAHHSLELVLAYAHAKVIADACLHVPVTRQAIDGNGLISDLSIRRGALEALSRLVAAAAFRDGNT
jgi:chromate reductase